MPAVVRANYLAMPLAFMVVVAASTSGAPPAEAQGLLQSLFGFGGSQPPRLPPQSYYPQRPGPPFMSPYARPGMGGGFGNEGGGGSYRTVCVRMCDGYYWPVSHGVSRSRFGRDAQACQSSCGNEARLFYAPGNGSTEDMVDLSGRAYSQIPNAFKYRKALSPSCACKPAPWSQSELARHQRYAVEAGRAPAGVVASADNPKPPSAPHTSIVIVEPALPNAQAIARPSTPNGSMTQANQPGRKHAVQNVEPAPIQAVPIQPLQAQPQPGQVPLAQPYDPRTRPAASATVRNAGTQPISRPGPRMGVGGPTSQPQVKVASKPSATSGAPVYSHETGRFIFPGENRYR